MLAIALILFCLCRELVFKTAQEVPVLAIIAEACIDLICTLNKNLHPTQLSALVSCVPKPVNQNGMVDEKFQRPGILGRQVAKGHHIHFNYEHKTLSFSRQGKEFSFTAHLLNARHYTRYRCNTSFNSHKFFILLSCLNS